MLAFGILPFTRLLLGCSNEMRKDLEPRLARTGDQALLQPFLEFFKDKPLSNGSTILSIWESAPRAPFCRAVKSHR